MLAIPVFVLLLILLGLGSFLYFRQLQDQNAPPKDKYDEAWETYIKSQPAAEPRPAAKSARRILVFFAPLLLIALAFLIFVIAGSQGTSLANPTFYFLALAFSPFLMLFFPAGLVKLILPSFQAGASLGTLTLSSFGGLTVYAALFAASLYAKNRRALAVIYFIYIFLLVANLIGGRTLLAEIMAQIELQIRNRYNFIP